MIENQLRELNDSMVQKRMVIGPAFSTIADLVLKYGRPFNRLPLPKGRWGREPGLCYANALRAAKTRRYIYVEGYAVRRTGGIPQHHAWVTVPASPSVAYDPTWSHGAEYFGIPFRLDYLIKMQEALGCPGVLDAWEMNWPLVSGEHRIEDAICEAKAEEAKES